MLEVAFGIAPDATDFELLREEFLLNYEAKMLERTHAFVGVAALIEALRERGLRWGVVTNKASRFTNPLVRAMPLFATAEAVVSGDTTPHAKPHPEPLFEAARRLGVEPSACVYVGDDERDIIAGRAAGMQTVAASYGYMGAQADVNRWMADVEIDSPLELLKWLNAA